MSERYLSDTHCGVDVYSREAIEVFQRTEKAFNIIALLGLPELGYELRFADLLARLRELSILGCDKQMFFTQLDTDSERHRLLASPFVIADGNNESRMGLRLTFNTPGYDARGEDGYNIQDYFLDIQKKKIAGTHSFSKESKENDRKAWWTRPDTGPVVFMDSRDEERGLELLVRMGRSYVENDVPDMLRQLCSPQCDTGNLDIVMEKLASYSSVMQEEFSALHTTIVH